MRLRSADRQQRGDTIVEVLIAVAVVTSVLAGAFTVSQASTLAVRDSQERGEALQLLQGQVELVRAAALKETSDATGIYGKAPIKYFCMRESDRTRSNFSLNTYPALNADNFASSVYGSDCQKIKTAAGAQTRYNIAITYDEPGGSKVFTFTNRWHGVDGKKKEQVMMYRIHPGVASLPPPAATGDALLVAPPPSGSPTCWRTYGWFAPGCWKPTAINQSSSPQSIITKCEYAWYVDSSQPPVEIYEYPGSDPKCAAGGKQTHAYTPVGPAPPGDPATADATGYYKFYKVILTNYFNNGSEPKKHSFTYRLPG